jgi:3-dehydroquinate synthase
LHGEAVAAGLGLAFDFSVAKQICKPEDALRVHAHLMEVGLPDNYSALPAGKAAVSTLIQHMKKDKKAFAGNLTFILTHKIGEACVMPNISETELTTFFMAKGVNHV